MKITGDPKKWAKLEPGSRVDIVATGGRVLARDEEVVDIDRELGRVTVRAQLDVERVLTFSIDTGEEVRVL